MLFLNRTHCIIRLLKLSLFGVYIKIIRLMNSTHKTLKGGMHFLASYISCTINIQHVLKRIMTSANSAAGRVVQEINS